MPARAPPVTNERQALAAYLRQQQDAFRAAAYGLTDRQARLRPTPSALSVGALVKHATAVQDSWVELALVAPDRDRRLRGWPETPWLRPWRPAEGRPPAEPRPPAERERATGPQRAV